MKLSPPNQFTILIFFSTELWTHSNEGSVKCQKNKTKTDLTELVWNADE